MVTAATRTNGTASVHRRGRSEGPNASLATFRHRRTCSHSPKAANAPVEMAIHSGIMRLPRGVAQPQEAEQIEAKQTEPCGGERPEKIRRFCGGWAQSGRIHGIDT